MHGNQDVYSLKRRIRENGRTAIRCLTIKEHLLHLLIVLIFLQMETLNLEIQYSMWLYELHVPETLWKKSALYGKETNKDRTAISRCRDGEERKKQSYDYSAKGDGRAELFFPHPPLAMRASQHPQLELVLPNATALAPPIFAHNFLKFYSICQSSSFRSHPPLTPPNSPNRRRRHGSQDQDYRSQGEHLPRTSGP